MCSVFAIKGGFMSSIESVSSYAPKSIVAPKKTPETSMERFQKKEQVKREVAYQIAKSKPKEERTDKDKQAIASYHIGNILSSPKLNPKSTDRVIYMA